MSKPEQRPIKAVQVINNATDQDLIWLDSLTHAREWITGATLLYMLDSLVVGNKQAGISFRKNYIIIPVVNPDGYAHTWISDRMWRKTRSQSSGSGCIGVSGSESGCKALKTTLELTKLVSSKVDINRNYNHTFGGYGSSNETCSEVYKGSSALSEPETRALSKLLFSLKDRVKFFLTIHSFSQYWTCPHAYTNKPSKSFNKHMHVLRAIQKAVYQAEGLKYQIGPYGKLVYLASGFSLDFAYETCAIEHSYLVELRDEGAEGFNLSASQIIPTARETLAGLNAGLEIVFGHSEIV